ncbi:MAG: DUF3566 domain-containing protein [Marmoricola sp.]
MATSRQHGTQDYRTDPAKSRTGTPAGAGDTPAGTASEATGDGAAGSRIGRRAAVDRNRDRREEAGDDRRDTRTDGSAVRVVRTRRAHLRIVHVDPWSVMKTSFLLSIALGIVVVVAVAIIWGVLGAAGVWDSINSAVGQVADSPNDPTPFDITTYIGTSRVVGFALIASVIDIVLITAIATLGAFVYNLAASLVGGVGMTFTEDR